MPPRNQAVLRELYAWREARAAAADRPPFKIVGPEVLLALPEDELPRREPSARPAQSAATGRRIEALRAWRDDEAVRCELDPAVVMSQRLIERIAAAAPNSLTELAAIEVVRRWRVAAWGPALLAASSN